MQRTDSTEHCIADYQDHIISEYRNSEDLRVTTSHRIPKMETSKPLKAEAKKLHREKSIGRPKDDDNESEDESYWEKQKHTYRGSGQRKTLHGIVYQLKHLMFILLCAREMKEKKEISDYSLASEMESAGSLDDIVLRYKKNLIANGLNNGNMDERNLAGYMHRFVQLKHNQSGKDEIKLLKFLKDRKFGLKKYYTSWLKIHKHFQESSKDSKDFILCTNHKLSKNLRFNKGFPRTKKTEGTRAEELGGSDDFLKVARGNENHFRLIVEEPEKTELHDILNSESDVHRLAEELAKCVDDAIKGRLNLCCKLGLRLEIDMFKKYQFALKEYVIDMDRQKFSDDFIVKEDENLLPEVANFRAIFLRKIVSLTKGNDKTITKEDLKSLSLHISPDFAAEKNKSSESHLKLPNDGNKLVKHDEMEEFLHSFHLVVAQPDEVTLGMMMKHEFSKTRKFLNNNFVINYFEKNIWNWLKTRRGCFFTDKNVEYFFDKAECELSSLITVGLNLSHLAELQEHENNFNSLGIEHYQKNKELVNFLKTSEGNKAEGNEADKCQILRLICYETTVLTATRLYSLIRDYIKKEENFVENDSFLFIHLKKLLSPVVMEHVLRAFKSTVSNNLLVIDCGSKSVPEDADEFFTTFYGKLWEKLSEILQNGHEKRLILITDINDSTVNLEHRHQILYARSDSLGTEPCIYENGTM